MENNNIKNVEEALLGLVLANKKIDDKISQIFIFLNKDFFSTKENQEFFEMLKYFYENNIKEFDFIIIKKYIEDKSLEKIITMDYLNNLLNKSGFVKSLNHYLNLINENYSKNKLKKSLEESLKIIQKENSTALIDDLRNKLYDIENRKINDQFLKGEDVAKKVVNEVFSGKKNIKGIRTGFNHLDNITTGLQKGDLIILAARPSIGKTAFALNLAKNILLLFDNVSIAFFSLEMPAEQLMQRMLSNIANINNYKFKEPEKLNMEDKNKIIHALEKLKNKNFFIDDSGSIKLNEIVWKSKKLKEKGLLDLIIIDYMQLIPVEFSKGSGNRQQEVAKISRTLKQLARELEIPIIALSQLNRRVEERDSKRPVMFDLRESGSIEQDADIIAFLYRKDYYEKNEEKELDNKHITELIIAKHRNGSTGTLDFLFDSSTGKFISYKIEDN